MHRSIPSAPSPLPQMLARALVCCVLAVPLAACGVDRTVTGSIISEDFKQNHPVVLTNAPETLDVFPIGSGGGLDPVSARRVEEFAEHYKVRGQGQITILAPSGARGEHVTRNALAAVRTHLVKGGVKGMVGVGSYPVADPSLASPIRLSYETLKARVATTCGQWPADLASGSSLESWTNRPWFNYGCAYQRNLTAQIDDPRDLVAPRPETPSDTEMRSRAITNVRKGIDPGTEWRIKNTEISNVGGK